MVDSTDIASMDHAAVVEDVGVSGLDQGSRIQVLHGRRIVTDARENNCTVEQRSNTADAVQPTHRQTASITRPFDACTRRNVPL